MSEQQDIYSFIINPIRQMDAKTEFLRRFLMGPQFVFESTQEKIRRLTDLFNYDTCPEHLLTYLKDHVGFTKELNHITRDLSPGDLRRLISVAIPLWNQKGTEQGLKNLIRVLTGRVVKLNNWFYYRWIVDERQVGENQDGSDIYLLSDIGTDGEWDEFTSDLRIMDEGYLNRRLLQDLVELMRPASERYTIFYLDFLEDFSRGTSQWEIHADDAQVADDMLTLMPGSTISVDVVNSQSWKGYTASWLMKVMEGSVFRLSFYFTDPDNYYFAEIDASVPRAILGKRLGGMETYLSGYSPILISYGTFYTFRIAVQRSTATEKNRIRFYLDGDLIATAEDSSLTHGSIGMITGPDATVICDEVELFRFPLRMDRVGP